MSHVRYAATGWLLRHASRMNRRLALERCARYLQKSHRLGQESAYREALQALAEVESANRREWIDTDVSTAHVVVVRREGGAPLAFTVSDLLAMYRTALACGAAASKRYH